MADGEIPNSQPFGEFGGIQGIMQILQGLFGGASSSNSESNSPEGMASAMALLGPVLQEFGQNDYSAGAAERDSKGSVEQIIRQMSESGNPIIQNAENASGGYSSTTAGLLRNELGTRIAVAGSAEIANTKTKYAAARQAQLSQILSLIKIIADAHRTQAVNNQTQGLVNNTAARNAAAAAALAAAARQALKPTAGQAAGQKPGGGGGVGVGAGGKGGPLDQMTPLEEPKYDDIYDYKGEGTDDPSNESAGLAFPDNSDESAGLNFPDNSNESAGLDMSGNDPFALMGDLGDLGNLDNIDQFDFGSLGDTSGSGDGNSGSDTGLSLPDFTFGDGSDNPDFWLPNGDSGDGDPGDPGDGDPGGGFGIPGTDE